ncbi:MAG TPA: NAD-dependent epimerase/dehydratase family protein, partial [Candidatus Babeliaceae bacterium]|nr:NAD-dependent epimerase/dehydratase family protein [Candidatus Babeliaceae bacterium]
PDRGADSRPLKEEEIWDGPPHASESGYAHAKRAMLAQLQAYQENQGLNFAYIISTNLYGPNDKYDVEQGHVLPSLIRKFYEAKRNNSEVVVWGDGSARRDFLYSKDMARALVLIMNKYAGPINIASGIKRRIKDVAELLADYIGMQGRIQWDRQMPNGREFCDLNLTKMESIGFEPQYTLETGLKESIDWFIHHYEKQLIRC